MNSFVLFCIIVVLLGGLCYQNEHNKTMENRIKEVEKITEELEIHLFLIDKKYNEGKLDGKGAAFAKERQKLMAMQDIMKTWGRLPIDKRLE